MYLKKIPIVFTFDATYLLPAAIAIKSLLDHAKSDTYYDVYLVGKNFSSRQKHFLTSKLGIEHVNYTINWIIPDKKILNSVPTNSGWSTAVYYRLLAPQYILNYEKVIYSDVDVIFQDDLSDIYQQDMRGYDWAGVVAERNSEAMCHQRYPEYTHDDIFLSGFMILNLTKMREDQAVSRFLKNIKKFSSRLRMFDLEILNLSCNRIKSIPLKYCVLENIYDPGNFRSTYEYSWLSNYYSDDKIVTAKRNAVVIHYAGKATKVWRRPLYKIYEPYLSYVRLFKKEYMELNHYTSFLYLISELSFYRTLYKYYPEAFILKTSGYVATLVHKIVMNIPATTRRKVKDALFG